MEMNMCLKISCKYFKDGNEILFLVGCKIQNWMS